MLGCPLAIGIYPKEINMNFKTGSRLALFVAIGAVTTLAWTSTLPRSVVASLVDRGGQGAVVAPGDCDCRQTWDMTLTCPKNSALPCPTSVTRCSFHPPKNGICNATISQPCDEDTTLCQEYQQRTCKPADCNVVSF